MSWWAMVCQKVGSDGGGDGGDGGEDGGGGTAGGAGGAFATRIRTLCTPHDSSLAPWLTVEVIRTGRLTAEVTTTAASSTGP